MGGTYLYIRGTGFDNDPAMNMVFIGSSKCKVDGASVNFLSCITPALPEGSY